MSVTETAPAPVAAWDEPTGATARGTLVLLPGRGETARSYERFGRRLSADAWKVRLVAADVGDPGAVRAAVQAVLDDDRLPSPRVLVGVDTGAALATTLATELAVDGVVVAGPALPGSAPVTGWQEELEARSACPVHRRVLGDDDGFGRGALATGLPESWEPDPGPGVRVLVLHGAADPVTPADTVVASYATVPEARVLLVEGGRHDVLNDVSHRSVAAEVVLFLESLRLGPGLPAVLTRVPTPAGAR